MEADFSGYATKAGLKCSDGRTIQPDAFKHQDKVKVPLVWQHNHNDPENVLGHMLLENREDGVYGYAFFNDTNKAKHARKLVEHKDITMMSIWANDIIERAKRVMHGAIREVSLVLSGANPGALIDNITVRHGDGDEEILDDEAIIYTGLTFEHSDKVVVDDAGGTDDTKDKTQDVGSQLDPDLQKVFASMSDEQKELVHSMIQHAAATATDDDAAEDEQDVLSLQDIYESMTEVQQQLCHYMVGEALEAAKSDDTDDSVQQDNLGDDDGTNDKSKGTAVVKHNVFENDTKDDKPSYTLSHSDVETIVADAKRPGNTLKSAVENFAISHGIEDIDVLFPEAQAIANAPELFSRRQEWVQAFMNGVNKSPFARIKTLSADITVQEARAKGYITGSMKKEEFFKATKRVTTPTTVYKKQKLDRDDMIDITDFDVVAWLKGEMRLMLDEELARAALLGDGRAVDDEDKVNEDCIRPILTDSEVYVTRVTVAQTALDTSINAFVDSVALNRQYLRGTGLPTLFTSEKYIARFLTLRDTLGRRIYQDMAAVAADLRVQSVVPIQLMEEYPDVIGILVNPADYTIGANQGGQVSLFDFFDIDYNQYKYLIETRASGCLTKLKSAMIVLVETGETAVTPASPTFDGTAITIVNETGVVYRNAATDAVMNAAGSPYAVPAGTEITVTSEPAAGYYFPTTANDTWTFRNEA